MSDESDPSSIPQPPPGAEDAAYPALEELAQLLPQYEMHSIIGVGGMGAVYKARQVTLDRWVAIKVLPIAASQNMEDTQRFIKEARSMAKLVHPHIVAVFDFGQTYARHLFLVMEYVDGRDLHVRTRDGEITPQRAREIIAQLCDALQFAHDRGVAHRDIKPANILINEDWKVKVADFGLARDLTASPNADEPEYGTPDYTAPERLIIGAVVDHRADIYALGVVIHEMLTGKTPAAAGKKAGEGLPEGFAGVISKCLMSDPDRRYQKASEVKAALLNATAERMRQEAAPETPAVTHQPQIHLETPESYTRYRPSLRSRLGRRLGPIAWGVACVLLVAGFAWVALKDRITIEMPEKPVITLKTDSPDKPTPAVSPTPEPSVATEQPAMQTPPPAVTPAPVVLPTPAISATPKVEAPVFTLIDGPPAEIARFDGHAGSVYSVKLLKDQRRAISCGLDGSVRLWHLADQKNVQTYNFNISQLNRLQLSTDEQIGLVYSTQTDKLVAFEVDTGRVIEEASMPHDRLNTALLMADGKTALIGGTQDNGENNVFIWKIGTGQDLQSIPGFIGRVYGFLGSQDGMDAHLFGAVIVDMEKKSTRPKLMNYTAATGQLTDLNSDYNGYLSRVTAAPGASLAVSSSGTLQVHSLPDFKLIKVVTQAQIGGVYPNAAQLVDHDRLILSVWSDSTLRVHEAASGEELWNTRTAEPGTDLVVSQDERWALVSPRFADPKKSSQGQFDLLLWRLPKWSSLMNTTAVAAEIVTRLSDLTRRDPELASLREKVRQAFPPVDPAEFTSQRQNLDTLYVTAIRRESQGLSPTEANAMKAEEERIRQKAALPPEGMDASLPPRLQKLRAIYRQQLTVQEKKETDTYLSVAKFIQSYFLPLQQKRAAAGDAIGAGCVEAVMKEWPSGKAQQPISTPGNNAGAVTAGTPTRRPNRAGSVSAIQRTALNTNISSPLPDVSRVPRNLPPAVALAGGSEHVFTLLADGSLRAWGLWKGEPASAPSSATDIVQIDSTDDTALALRSDGKIIAWSPGSVSKPLILQVPDGRAPVSVHAGPEGSGYALCSDGSLHVVGTAVPHPPTSEIVQRLIYQPTTRGWSVLQRDGSPLYWGAQLPNVLPLPDGLRDLVDLEIASGYAVALQRDGTLTGWGKTAPDQSFRRRQFTGAIEVVHDHADRIFAVHRSDHSWELATNPNIPGYVAEDRISVLEGRLRGAIQAVFTREYVIALKP